MVDTKFQTSFIPKQPVGKEQKHTTAGVGVVFLISFLIMVASVAAGAGVFIWNKTVLSSIAEGRKELEKHNAAFDSNSIREFTRLDNRIDVANRLLKQHVRPSEIFPRLAANTLKTVRFTNYKYTNTGDGKIMINMSGEAQDYESMALQAKQFTKPGLQNSFRSPIFSNFNKNEKNVVFTFVSGIDPYVIDYYQSRINEQKNGEQTNSVPTSNRTMTTPTLPNQNLDQIPAQIPAQIPTRVPPNNRN